MKRKPQEQKGIVRPEAGCGLAWRGNSIVIYEGIKLIRSSKSGYHPGQCYHTSKTEGVNKSTLSVCLAFVSPATLKSD